jgi:predicted nuclease of predicted toxin-antitoxin system
MRPNWRASASSKSAGAARHEVQDRRNLPREACELLKGAGHDALSVGEQALSGAADAEVYRRCQDERRALVTLDIDFANIQAYDPNSSAGVIVLRLARQNKAPVLDAVARILPVLEREPLNRRLWVVEDERVRIRA